MQQAQIVIQYVNPPRDPSWSHGSVKDQGGQLWSVHKDALGMFVKGQASNIGFEPPSGNRKLPTITSVNGTPVGQPAAAGFTPVGQAAAAATGQQGWQPQTQAAPAPPQQPHAPTPTPHRGGVSTDCCIFVTGIIGRCLQGTGSFPDIASLRSMVYNAKLAFEIEMEGKPEPQAQAQLLTGQQLAAQGGPPPGHPADAPFNDDITM